MPRAMAPVGVGPSTISPCAGKFPAASRYWSYSKRMQHFSFPQHPSTEIGLSDISCSLAIFTLTDWNWRYQQEQQMGRPQGPSPPVIAA